MNEQYLVRRTKYVASPFLQLYDVLRGVTLQPASYFFNLFVTLPQQIETFLLFETIKSMHEKERNVLEILFGVSLSAVALLFYHSDPGHIVL